MSLKQEIFTTVITKLREQNAPSIDNVGNCVYRGPNGRRCAIGWLIPNELYTPEIEWTFPWEVFRIMYGKAFIHGDLCHFLREIQKIHDKFWYPLGGFDQVEPRYKKFAQKWGLNYPE